jgi:hypothetical protein
VQVEQTTQTPKSPVSDRPVHCGYECLLRCLLGPREDALIPSTRNSGVFFTGVIFYADALIRAHVARKAFAFCAVDQLLQVRIVGAPECCAAIDSADAQQWRRGVCRLCAS